MELKFYKAQIDVNDDSDLEVSYIGLVEKPAIERNFQAFNDIKKRSKFVFDEDKRIISGPVMIADIPIYRKDDQLGEYYVSFDKQSILHVVQKFSSKGYLKNFNLFHDMEQKLDDVVIFNSFVSDKDLGILPMTGFEDLADGTWFISAKVNSLDTWARVKSGDIKGFSAEGLFKYVPVTTQKYTMEEAYEKISRILSETIFVE